MSRVPVCKQVEANTCVSPSDFLNALFALLGLVLYGLCFGFEPPRAVRQLDDVELFACILRDGCDLKLVACGRPSGDHQVYVRSSDIAFCFNAFSSFAQAVVDHALLVWILEVVHRLPLLYRVCPPSFPCVEHCLAHVFTVVREVANV
ncbi:hypothetical protein B0T17DRAFT_518547 [Bombardia bombarda]|uniref:Uncharacterized protein n=1 Tax=Bombardia bombarda TaxID=252184 RepID=A0AA40CG39_9PEZI|nr:hypothetical protein B0T17DRAFT_518547 [Bombardia bombarda]